MQATNLKTQALISDPETQTHQLLTTTKLTSPQTQTPELSLPNLRPQTPASDLQNNTQNSDPDFRLNHHTSKPRPPYQALELKPQNQGTLDPNL